MTRKSKLIIHRDFKSLSVGKLFYSKIKDSENHPFRVTIKKATVLIQLKKILDSETIQLLFTTDFFDSEDTYTITAKTVTNSRLTLFRCDDSTNSFVCIDSLPSKVKLMDIMIKYYAKSDEDTKQAFIDSVTNFIIDYYYDYGNDTIVRFNSSNNFIKKYVEKSNRYQIDGDSFYFKQYKNIEEKMKKFILDKRGIFISGKAGTGKTTSILGITKQYSSSSILILAPTNAAVMRLKTLISSEMKNITIKTIHSASTSESGKHYDLMIIDESSMLSTKLVGMILNLHTSADTKNIIFVGDYRQLPPVDKGNFFKTAIEKYSDDIHHNELTKVYRQESTDILRLANVFATNEVCNYRISIDMICGLVESDSIDVYDYNGYSANMKKRIKLTSDYNLNNHMVAYTNKIVYDINNIAYRLVVGSEYQYNSNDKYLVQNLKLRATVTNTKNKNVISYANNQYVEVVSWDSTSVTIRDIFTRNEVTIPIRELNRDFTIGYCSTIHTAQGLGFDTVDFFMSRRGYSIDKELYYTAITRAKSHLNLIKGEWNNEFMCTITEDIRNTFY